MNIMETKEQLVVCDSCGRKFKLIEINPNGCGWENETYRCPYSDCRGTSHRKTPGYFRTEIPHTKG